MKYTDCIPGKIYKTQFRDKDYWVIEFKNANEVNYFTGKGVYRGSRNYESTKEIDGLAHFKDDWTFSEPSEDDLQAFYNKYPELNKNIIYEIY